MKKTLIILLHIGFWGCYLILTLVLLATFFGGNDNPPESEIEQVFNIILFFAIVPAAITFYTFYFYLFPKFILKNRLLKGFGIGVLISLIAAGIGYTLLVMNIGPECLEEGEDEGILFGVILFIAFIAFISGIIALVIQGFIKWFEEIKLKETLREKNTEMELALLKAQLDPHFLFNTINNIDMLIAKDSEKASLYINKLSEILRFMLYEAKTENIPLEMELDYIEKYITLQRIRTNNESYVNYTVSGSPDNHKIAPMLFIPIIENAFKHTNNKKVKDAITIELVLNPKSILFLCKNKFSQNQSSDSDRQGLGNDLIRKRLELLYPNLHTLEQTENSGLYTVELKINHA